MAIKFSIAVANGRNDSIITTIGASSRLKLRSGAPPAAADDPDSGTEIAVMILPPVWVAASAGGVLSMAGLWEDLSADLAGVVGHYRIYDSTGAITGIQGSCSLPAGGGDMILSNTNVALGQAITVLSWTITDGNL